MSVIPDHFISTAQYAKVLGISPQAVLKRIKSGRIKAVKVGRSYAIPKSYVQDNVPSAFRLVDKAQDYLSVMEAADLLGVSRFAILKRIERGQLKARKIGRHYVLDREQIVNEPKAVGSTCSDKEFLSIPECAKLLQTSRISIFKKVKKGLIPAKKVGRHYVIARADLGIPLKTAASTVSKDHWSVMEVSKKLGVSRIAVFKQIKSGKIKAIKIGRSYAIAKSDFENKES